MGKVLLQAAIQTASSTTTSAYPAPNSGSYIGSKGSYAVQGSPINVGGEVGSVNNGWDGLVRRTYSGIWSNSGGNDNPSIFNGSPVETIDSDVYVSFGSQSVPATNYCMEWKGYVQAPNTDAYNFYLESDDYAMFWIGVNALNPDANMPLLTTNNGGQLNIDSVNLTGGQFYPIRIRFQEIAGGEYCQLYMGQGGGTLLSMNNYYMLNNHNSGGYN